RIDHAGHANYPAANVHETLAFDEAVGTAHDFAENNKDTLVIVSADHETGGMSIGADGTYGFNRDTLKNMKRSSEYIASQLNKKRSNTKTVMEKFAGINDLNESEMKLIQNAEKADSAIAKVVSDRALIGWTTTGHTADHVPDNAYGTISEHFSGPIYNIDINIRLCKRKCVHEKNLNWIDYNFTHSSSFTRLCIWSTIGTLKWNDRQYRNCRIDFRCDGCRIIISHITDQL